MIIIKIFFYHQLNKKIFVYFLVQGLKTVDYMLNKYSNQIILDYIYRNTFILIIFILVTKNYVSI